MRLDSLLRQVGHGFRSVRMAAAAHQVRSCKWVRRFFAFEGHKAGRMPDRLPQRDWPLRTLEKTLLSRSGLETLPGRGAHLRALQRPAEIGAEARCAGPLALTNAQSGKVYTAGSRRGSPRQPRECLVAF